MSEQTREAIQEPAMLLDMATVRAIVRTMEKQADTLAKLERQVEQTQPLEVVSQETYRYRRTLGDFTVEFESTDAAWVDAARARAPHGEA